MRLASLSLARFALLVAPAAAAPVVPATVPKYFCLGNAIIAWRLIAYLGANYILHAAAIPSSVDIGRYTERVTRRDTYRWDMAGARLTVYPVLCPRTDHHPHCGAAQVQGGRCPCGSASRRPACRGQRHRLGA